MTSSTLHLGTNNAYASGSSFQAKSKRKYAIEDSEDDFDMHVTVVRVHSPPLKRRTTFPPPDLMTDHSNSASDEDQTMDMDEDADQDMESLIFETHAFDRGGEIDYGLIRRGGFGFGPGAEEDEPVESISRGRRDHSSKYLHRGQKMSFIRFPSEYYPSVSVYPSLTPHPHPSHFTNLPPYTSRTASSASSLPLAHNRPASPWSAQPYSTTLRAPIPIRGLLQPALATPVSADASDIEKARAQHGSQCKSIPKLVMSLHPDPITGEKSMWSICGDCGACEKAA